MKDWILTYSDFVPDEEGAREALCALGNGYFCTRGAGAESNADEIHYPGTYGAGIYNRLCTPLGGREVWNEDLVNLPNWLCLTFRPEDGDWFNLRAGEILDYHQELDVRQGVLTRRVRFRDRTSRETTVVMRRFVHMGQRHMAALEMTLQPENWSGPVRIRSAIDGRVINGGVERYRELNSNHLEPLESGRVDKDGIFLRVRTRQSRVEIVEAARTRLYRDGKPCTADRRTIEEDGFIDDEVSVDLAAGEIVRVEKVVALFTSRDQAISECGAAAREAIGLAGNFDELLATHVEAWDDLWRICDVEIIPDGMPQLIFRLYIFHLLQTTSPNSIELDAGVPARGLHGEAYRGHVFWDELFILPSLTLRLPTITRSLLLYRYRRLEEARRSAQSAGLRGAMYPWQSGSDGREDSQLIHLNPRSGRWIPDVSWLQRHVNAAIAYNVWQYVHVSDDRDFLSYYGAEMMLEIARFWASIVTYDSARERYVILGVIGPDEYHDGYPDSESPGLNNNTYTNVMAVWALSHALEVIELLDGERRHTLFERLGLSDEELARWDEISRKMFVPFHDDGIISQFEGYESLEELDWAAYRKRYGDIARLDRILEAEGDTPNRYKLSKQADVLMLFYLFSSEQLSALFERLGYTFESDMIPRNIAYYVARTSHGSSLSRVVHSSVLSRLDRTRSWDLFREALQSDVSGGIGGTIAEGIHLGAMAGTVDIVQRIYTGLEIREGMLRFSPCLPDNLTAVRERLYYRGHWLSVEVTHDSLTITIGEGPSSPVDVAVSDEIHTIRAGETISVSF
jgi:trehalose/maltose hydrolase-like predicted phosphorylase